MFKANLEIQKKVDEILQDSDTVNWIETIDSESAQINYQKHLAEYLIHRKSTISKLVSSFKKDENNEIKNVQSFANQMLKRLAPGTVANYVSAILTSYGASQIRTDKGIMNRSKGRDADLEPRNLQQAQKYVDMPDVVYDVRDAIYQLNQKLDRACAIPYNTWYL